MNRYENLLQALRSLPQEGMTDEAAKRIDQLLRDEGLTSPAEFADFLLQLVEYERQLGRKSAVTRAALLAVDERRSPNLEIRHRRPKIPFYYQGVQMEPTDINRFDGRPLHFIVVQEGVEARLIATDLFRDALYLSERKELLSRVKAEIAALMKPLTTVEDLGSDGTIVILGEGKQEWGEPDASGSGGMAVPCPKGAAYPNPDAQFFQHPHFSTDGHWLWLGPGWAIEELTKWSLSHALFSGGASWNDEISSIKSGEGILICYEAIHWQGCTLQVSGTKPQPVFANVTPHPMCGVPVARWDINPPRQNISDLAPLGWGDRISSIEHIAVA